MDFIEELKWRGMLHDCTPGLEEVLKQQKIVGYIGFDPTAPSLTIGNYVQIMLLKLFSQAGHRPVVLLGGATGRIGDPSFKNEERVLKSEEEIENNLRHQMLQFRQLLSGKEEEKELLVLNNYDFYKEMNVLEFLRDAGKTLTVAYMMAKESVKRRVESGLSFTEFSYQLLQAYDFQKLYKDHGILLQMGGSDQWGNITSGTEFIRRNLSGKAYALTTPLLTKSDGTKFGKSEKGNIWLDAQLTSPYTFYQFWINADDLDLERYVKTFSLKSREEMIVMLEEMKTQPNLVKRKLAFEMTERIHSLASAEQAEKVSQLLFGKVNGIEDLRSLVEDSFQIVAREVPFLTLSPKDWDSTTLVDLLVDRMKVFHSNSDLRRAIQGNALSLNKIKIQDISFDLSQLELIHNRYLLIENGKKSKYLMLCSD
jgi:tyrosyl-tRNA synthetase